MSKQPFNIDTDEMAGIVEACRVLRLLSKKKSVAELVDYLMNKEILHKNSDDTLTWSKGDIALFDRIEKKFTNRLKEHGLGSMVKKS